MINMGTESKAGHQDTVPQPSPVAASAEHSVLHVMDGGELKDRPAMPGNIYFYVVDLEKRAIPPDEEQAHQEIEAVCSVLRIAFQQDEPDLFQKFFLRLLAAAQATFSDTGFRREALGDLPVFKQEVVKTAGAKIKERYTKKLLKAVGCAVLILLAASAVLDVALRVGHVIGNRGSWIFIHWDPSISILHTGMLLAASMVGLFFASVTRNIEPTFETLVTSDADLMPPWLRLFFYGIAVLILALVFQLKLVTFHIGDVFSTADISTSAPAAIFVGLLLGVLERALPQEVQKWSRELIRKSG